MKKILLPYDQSKETCQASKYINERILDTSIKQDHLQSTCLRSKIVY